LRPSLQSRQLAETNNTRNQWGLLRRLYGYARPYRNRFYGSLGLAIVLALLTPIRPWLIQQTVNVYIAQSLTNLLIWVTVIQIGLLLFETAIRFLFSFQTAWLGQAVVRDLRVNVFKHITHLNLRQFDRTPIGTLTTRTINDLESINDVFADGLIPILADLLSITCVLSYMFWADWQLTLVALIPFPILIIATYFFKESTRKSFQKVRTAVADLNAFVQEHLSGMSLVQAFVAEQREQQKFDRINKHHRNANIQAIFAYSVFFPVVEIVLALSIGAVVWWTSEEAVMMQESRQGIVISFILCLNLLFRPLRMIADKFNVLQMGVIAGERVFKVLDNDDHLTDTDDPLTTSQKLRGDIRFDQVCFSYVPDQPVLQDISFHVKPGETLAIVGATGSGKSTIINLLTRLYPIDSGQILLDDEPVERYDWRALRRQVGVVLQDVFLFSGTIRDNLTLHNPAISQTQVEQAARLIGMHDYISKLPLGYDQPVMERGSSLSLGQRQLLSFVRALLYDPAVLILDEATSSVDPESERLIQQASETLMRGRTSIVVAHRLSTIKKADRILVLDKGRILESGTHETLLKAEGVYARMIRTAGAAGTLNQP
jgi:ATP-binding cassette subfamily B multidrug efflux pump